MITLITAVNIPALKRFMEGKESNQFVSISEIPSFADASVDKGKGGRSSSGGREAKRRKLGTSSNSVLTAPVGGEDGEIDVTGAVLSAEISLRDRNTMLDATSRPFDAVLDLIAKHSHADGVGRFSSSARSKNGKHVFFHSTGKCNYS